MITRVIFARGSVVTQTRRKETELRFSPNGICQSLQ
jgi:hypothetical protein